MYELHFIVSYIF